MRGHFTVRYLLTAVSTPKPFKTMNLYLGSMGARVQWLAHQSAQKMFLFLFVCCTSLSTRYQWTILSNFTWLMSTFWVRRWWTVFFQVGLGQCGTFSLGFLACSHKNTESSGFIFPIRSNFIINFILISNAS